MDFAQLTATVTNFVQTHQFISIVALAALAFYFYQSPKQAFKFLVFIAIIAIAGYFVLRLDSSTDLGVSSKEELSQKTKKTLGD